MEKSNTRGAVNSELSVDQCTYLMSIADNPNRSVTQLKNDLGWSTDKANNVKKSLIDVGMIEAFTVNLGVTAGGLIKLLEITESRVSGVGYQTNIDPKGPCFCRTLVVAGSVA